jgi:predicted nucleotidyltransferase
MDIKSLLRLLNELKVRYLVIGAYAFPVYGYSRATMDIDIFIEPTIDNANCTLAALTKFGYDMSELTPDELLKKKILIRQYELETDIHPFVTGVTFENVWKNKKPGQIEGIPVNFPSLEDLIKMKGAAGRPKDLQDLEILQKLKDMGNGEKK